MQRFLNCGLFLVLLLFTNLLLPTSVSAQTNTRPTKYYAVDRVRTNSDFARLADWGIDTAIVNFKTNHSSSEWDSVVNAAAAANIKIVIWPDAHEGSDVSGCRWETPFDDASTNNDADFLLKVRPILNHLGNNPNVIGIVTAHEPVWVNSSDQERCGENIADMTSIKTAIHNHINNSVHRNTSYEPFKVWNYIDNIYNMSNLVDYSSSNVRAQIEGIMDVAVIWQHCAGYPTYSGDGSVCLGTSKYTALGGINFDRNLIRNNGLEGIVELVFLPQTFTAGGDYGGRFTLEELQNYSCQFLNTGALDGYAFYTWDEGWYPGNLKKWTDMQPAVPNIYNSCVNHSNSSPVPTVIPTTIPTSSPVSSPTPIPTSTGGSFRFASISDAHVEVSNFTNTLNQIKNLNPNIIIFNGDLENDGVKSSEFDPMINVFKNTSLFNSTFFVRGNHDDHLNGSSALWQSNFVTQNRPLPVGVNNYTALNTNSSYLTYSFDIGNARFIGLDINQDAGPPTSAQLTFLDTRLTEAENIGLTHAFIFTHAPFYCVADTHCLCTAKLDGSCSSSNLISIINRHPIVSATFHGHEHLFGWSHMDNTRIPGLTHSYEQFITSPAGNNYNLTAFPNRLDYYSSGSFRSFGVIDVNGRNFTVSHYKTGTSTPAWTKTFTKPVKIGDIDNDFDVDIYDYNLFIVDYGGVATRSDFNGSGTVDIADFDILKNNFGR